MDTQFMAPRSGRMIKEDGTIINIADILAGDADLRILWGKPLLIHTALHPGA